MKATEEDAGKRLGALIEDRRRLERDLAEARKKLAMAGGESGAAAPVMVDGVAFLGRVVHGIEVKDLKPLADEARQALGSGIVAIAGVAADGKAGIVVAVSADLTSRFDAVPLVRAAAERLGGKGGGGRRDMAQAGGPEGAAAEAALDAVAALLRVPAEAA